MGCQAATLLLKTTILLVESIVSWLNMIAELEIMVLGLRQVRVCLRGIITLKRALPSMGSPEGLY